LNVPFNPLPLIPSISLAGRTLATLFDIDFVTTQFGVTNLGHYIDVIKAASKTELVRFRSEVRQHERTHPKQQAFADIPDFSTHDGIVAAINHELRKRSFAFAIYKFTLPVKRFFASTLRGLELKNHDDFGILYSVPHRTRSVLHMSLGELGALLKQFFFAHWKFIVGSLIALVGALAKWFS
jgi:hypothetical protein